MDDHNDEGILARKKVAKAIPGDAEAEAQSKQQVASPKANDKNKEAITSITAVPLLMSLPHLPSESFSAVLSFLSLDDLQKYARPVCRALRNACDNDLRWLPIIAPPRLSREVLNLDRHGPYLRKLYTKYKRWGHQWIQLQETYSRADEQKLRAMKSALDGFFSLCPWPHPGKRHFRVSLPFSYPTPWLHRMVYCEACPTTTTAALATKTTTTTTTETAKPPPTKRTKTSDKDANADKELSTFFQQRERIVTGRNSRIFYTCPLHAAYVFETSDDEKVNVILQPVNFRRLEDGSKRDSLPDHDPELLNTWNRACASLLECYLWKKEIITPPCMNRLADLRDMNGKNKRHKMCRRKSARGRSVVQVNAQALVGMSDAVLTNVNVDKEDDRNVIVFIIAPHMFYIDKGGAGGGFRWIYSASLYDDDNDAQAVSTFQILDTIDDPKERIKQYTTIVLHAVLMELGGFHNCENAHCTLNNADSLGELEVCPLIPCPACICKLQMSGLLPDNDVAGFLSRLHGVLSKKPFAEVCRDDVLKLEEYGVRSA